MAGIYIHIPFCRQKCHYCNFFSVASLKSKDDLLDSLLREVEIRKDYLAGEPVNSVYFGGGTPSLLTADEINRIFEYLRKYHDITPGAEITLEANPDDISPEKLAELKSTPINRLSIGIQSFFDDDLAYLNRVHDSQQAYESIKNALDAGFINLTIDLIYGIPTLTEDKWKQNLDTFFSFGLPHLSAYALTVEAQTALYRLIQKHKAAPLDEQQSIDHFRILLEKSRQQNFIHYEISNFSIPGAYSKHNSLYWLGGNYLGLGPSAHSFNGTSRQWNIPNIARYMQLAGTGDLQPEKEVLTQNQKYNEYVMTSLRTSWGCDLEHLENVFGPKYRDYFLSLSERFLEEKKLFREGNVFLLSDEGKLFADGIASDLFIDDDNPAAGQRSIP
jgi:oxygen-independent coproporphyrinogen-3 oxidase